MAIIEAPYRIRPITPAAAKAARVKVIPQEVFEVVNELIIQNLKPNGSTKIYARVKQQDVVNEILKHAVLKEKLQESFPKTTLQSAIFDSGWLDFEEAYRDSGWSSVTYYKPAYNESAEPYFEFTSHQ